MNRLRWTMTFVCLGLISSLLICSSCDESITWRIDKPPLEKRIPILMPFEACVWHGGQATNHSGLLLPAPEEYFIRGFIKVDEEKARTLEKEYIWKSTNIDINLIERPTTSSIVDSFMTGNNYLQSAEFMQKHKKQSSFSSGKFIFNPKSRVLYFDIKNR